MSVRFVNWRGSTSHARRRIERVYNCAIAFVSQFTIYIQIYIQSYRDSHQNLNHKLGFKFSSAGILPMNPENITTKILVLFIRVRRSLSRQNPHNKPHVVTITPNTMLYEASSESFHTHTVCKCIMSIILSTLRVKAQK
jgi:hypothetical protein